MASVRLRQILVAAFAAWASASLAQSTVGDFAGTLVDPNGNLVTGQVDVKVVLQNAATGATASGLVNQDGSFEIKDLPPGTYDVAVPIPCCTYSPYAQKSVVISPGETQRTELHVTWGMNLGTIGDDPVQLGADMRAKTRNPTRRAPRSADGHPDLSGVWVDIADPTKPLPGFFGVPMKPWAAEMQRKLMSEITGQQFNAGAYCLPQFAIPTVGPFPYKFVQTPKLMIQIIEFVTPSVRQIFMDGRGHPTPNEWNPAWYGHSIGHWDGDTLVVDTVGYTETTPGFGIHSEKLHTVERYHRINYGTMAIEIHADDSDAWTGPYVVKITAGLAEKDEIQEWVCAENNELLGPIGWKGRP